MPAEDIQFINRFPSQERAKQSPQPQDVIKMSMRKQDFCDVLKARARLQYLSLRAFAAINKKTIFIMFYDLR
jgi:hypothetical protein